MVATAGLDTGDPLPKESLSGRCPFKQRWWREHAGALRRIDDMVSDEVPVGGPSPETV
jgi:hypothetical protein